MEAYAQAEYGEPSVLDAFVKSDIGLATWNAHNHLNVPIVRSQREWTPLQRRFILTAAAEYEQTDDTPDPSDVPSPSSARSVGTPRSTSRF